MKHLLIGAATALALAAAAHAQDATPAPGTMPDTAASADAAPAEAPAADAAPGAALATDASTVLATVNGVDITLGHLVALRSRLPEQYQQLPDDVLFDGMLDQVIQQQILTDANPPTPADEIGVENEIRAYQASRVIERLSAAPVDEAAVQTAYDAQYGDVEAATEYNARHILAETEEAAAAIKAELDGGADFAEVAQGQSTGPSGPSGGQLGWFGPGMMVPEFEEAVSGMTAGEVSDPVQTQFGWHIIKLDETREAAAPPLEEVRAALETEVRNAAIDAEVQRLTAEAAVERLEVEIDPALIRNDDLLEN